LIEIEQAARLLRRHVRGRADYRSIGRGDRRASLALGPQVLRDAEVDQLRIDAGRVAHEEDVLGLEIAVNDARVVHGDEAARRELHQIDHFGGGRTHAQERRERFALEVVHHHECRAVAQMAVVGDRDDVAVAYRGRQLGLTLEASLKALVIAAGVAHELDRDRRVERDVPRHPHAAHPAFADLAQQLVTVCDTRALCQKGVHRCSREMHSARISGRRRTFVSVDKPLAQ
jgi:hypothetical protein